MMFKLLLARLLGNKVYVGWVNVFKTTDGKLRVSAIPYDTKAAALMARSKTKSKYIGTTKIYLGLY